MKKRLLALFLLAVLGISLAACTSNDSGNTDTGVDTASSVKTETDSSTDTSSRTDSNGSDKSSATNSQKPATSTDSDSESSSTSSATVEYTPPPDGVPGYDPRVDHKMILTDVTRGSIVAVDLDNCAGDWRTLNWSQKGSTARIWEMYLGDKSLCGVKYRYSSYYDKHVILATGSGGSAYAIDYEGRSILWKVKDAKYNNKDISLYNAHSIEMLPNGDIVVATSGYAEKGANYENGGLHYYPAGEKVRSTFLPLPFAHAVLWDPSNECLWAVGFEGIVAVKVSGEGKNAKMTKIPEKSHKMSNFTGHDMVPAFGTDGMFWVSDNGNVYLFDSAKKTLTIDRLHTNSAIKGIAYFEDGTMLQSTWDTSFVVYLATSENDFQMRRGFIPTKNKFYKVHTMTEKYE